MIAWLKRYRDAASTLLINRRLAGHDRWSRDRLARHQCQHLAKLVGHAKRHSRFYRDLYGDLAFDPATPLETLPVMTKAMVMENFDRVVTDGRLRLSEIREHLQGAEGDALHLDEYRALCTSGTTGMPGVFVYNRREWNKVLADTLRWQNLIGLSPRFPRRLRLATVGAQNPAHVSYRLTASGDFGLYKLLCLDASANIDALVAALNDFRPDALLPYASLAAALAREQLAGRLRIRPRVVSTHSEVLTPDMAAAIERAWGSPPFDHYGLSEHPNCGCACRHRRGIHLFEDLFIAEVVDEGNRPVPPGEPGFKLLLTNLYNFTQPLIRYEVSDMLTLDPAPCPCGRPFRLVARIGGRNDDIILLPGEGGRTVAVQPLVFYNVMDTLEQVAQYQIVERPDGIHVRVAPRKDADRSALREAICDRITAGLGAAGAEVPVLHVDFVSAIERSFEHMGKAKLIVSARKPEFEKARPKQFT
jgi:phenylacetate-coenzyme A ligase PaaK-like adenylate-forming protein